MSNATVPLAIQMKLTDEMSCVINSHDLNNIFSGCCRSHFIKCPLAYSYKSCDWRNLRDYGTVHPQTGNRSSTNRLVL